jgi:hypothetical protein
MQQGNASILSIDANDKSKNAVPIGFIHGKGNNVDKFVMLNRDGVDEHSIQVEPGEKIAIEPNHDPKGRDVIMVGGKSGSGKSFIARNFAVRYHELYPDRKIRFISYLEEDTTIDSISEIIKRIKPERFLDEDGEIAADINDFSDSLLIVDDVEGYERKQKKLFNAIQSVIDMIATMGRHNASSIIVCSHLLTDYKRTRLFLGEAQQFVSFMSGVSEKQIQNLLGGYAGIDTKEIQALRRLPSRWICVRTQFPIVAIHEKGVFLLRPQSKTELSNSRLYNKRKRGGELYDNF